MISSPFGCANTLLEDLRLREMSRIGDSSHLVRFQSESVKRRSGRPTGPLDLCIHALVHLNGATSIPAFFNACLIPRPISTAPGVSP